MKKYSVLIVLILSLLLRCVYQLSLTDEILVSSSNNLNGKVVVIDPGHGGLDNGASVGNYKEDEINLEISLKLKLELESRGATVYLTRQDDQDMTQRDYMYSKQDDMYLRVINIDSYNADYLISIHLNASTSSSAWGSQVFYYKNSTNGQRLAQDIHDKMVEVTGSQKSISGCEFMVLRATETLGVLVECGFLTNDNERGQLINAAYQLKLIKAISDGIENFNYTYIETIN